MSGAVEVLRPGALTTVQDLGRPGFAASGVPRGGAMDSQAARAANRRVGNAGDAALLEITLAGPELRFEGAATVALAGDPFEIEVDGEPVEGSAVLRIAAGGRLAVGRARQGVRGWLAIAGGLDLAPVLGSRSTDLAGGFGGFGGRALAPGDRLPLGTPRNRAGSRGEDSEPSRLPSPSTGATLLRLLPGPDLGLVEGDAATRLTASRYRVDPRSDRRGVRLSGGDLPLLPHPPLRSQPVLAGTVQAPSARELILLGPDAPVTGGYPWVAQLAAADLGRLAHLAPGAEVHLAWIDFAAAERALDGEPPA